MASLGMELDISLLAEVLTFVDRMVSVNGKYLRLSMFVPFNYQESMKMMGLPNWLHWTAWFVKSLVFILITIMLITFMLKVKPQNPARWNF